MKKKLLFSVVLLAMGYAAGQVLSQSPPLPASQRAKQLRNSLQVSQDLIEEIQAVRAHLATNLERNPGTDSAARDVKLITALDKYLAADRLTEIVGTLEEFVEKSAGTDEARRAATAIQILKNESRQHLAPTPVDQNSPPAQGLPIDRNEGANIGNPGLEGGNDVKQNSLPLY